MSQKMSRITINVSEEDHKMLKVSASVLGMSMKNLILLSLEKYLKRSLAKSNKKTVKLKKNKLNEIFKR